MRTDDINVRDPFVLLHEDKYYLYGTRSATTWGPADSFDCYVSEDLHEWEGPYEVFHNDGSFWADRSYWAPECYYYKGSFYFMATFKSETRHMGVQILKADNPLGPFEIHSDGPVTPDDWECLDGTLYIEDDVPYMIFSHSFQQVADGDMCFLRLTQDLSAAAGKPEIMFKPKDAPWIIPFPYGSEEFGKSGDLYLSDGPFMHKCQNGTLLMIWSSFSRNGYAVGTAVSDNGRIDGNWHQEAQPLFDGNGGHGMIFYDKKGDMYYALHYPNDKLKEHPLFLKIKECNGRLVDNDH